LSNPHHISSLGPIATNEHHYECIILAGGLGTRLRSELPDLPKCMAPVAGKPFIQHLVDYLLKQGVERFIFSLGFMHESIENFIKTNYPSLNCYFSIENEPLGTGGAIKLATQYATQQNVLILNGDTMFAIDIQKLMDFHLQNNASCTLSLKPMEQFERYGVVETNKECYIQSFKEKQFYHEGLINGGVYALNISSFLQVNFDEKFSFEKDYLEKYYSSYKMMGLVQDSYFIDIGIPEDFKRADKELVNLIF